MELDSGNVNRKAVDHDSPVQNGDSEELDLIGEAFEKAWQDGTATPILEDYLQRGSGNARANLARRLLQIELWHRQLRHRQKRGEEPSLSEYRARFSPTDRDFQDLLQEWEANPAEFLQYDDSSGERKASLPGSMKIRSNQSAESSVESDSKTFGRYRQIRVLGKGAFGIVYLGHDDVLKRFVAIKVPTRSRFQKPEDAEEYLAEARMVSSLDYPHIVRVHDAGSADDGSIYVVYEFIEGSSLEEFVKASHPSVRESAQLLATVALALQYAHQRKVIHRDVKPANILIQDKTSKPYVADFGLAIREEDSLQQNVIAGTRAYMSPEQARGEGHRLDGRSDIFSLGVILYELLTGKKPFHGSTLTQTLDQVKSVAPHPPRELLDSIPAELERICLKAMSKRPSDRYATAAEFAADLEQWLQPAAAMAKIKPAVEVIPKKHSARPRQILVTVCMLQPRVVYCGLCCRNSARTLKATCDQRPNCWTRRVTVQPRMRRAGRRQPPDIRGEKSGG